MLKFSFFNESNLGIVVFTLIKRFSLIRDPAINPLQYVDQCIRFATVLLESMLDDRSQNQKADPQEWAQEFTHTFSIMSTLVQQNQVHEETKQRIERFMRKYKDIISNFKPRLIIIDIQNI